MLEGIRPTKADLTGRFGLSQRLSVRIGALLASKVELTATVLESAKPGSPVEAFFLRREILAEAASLDTDRIQTLAADAKLDLDLAVEDQGARRVIGLEEELAAAADFAAPPPALSGNGLALMPIDVDPMLALMPAAGALAGASMSADDVAKLKLTILTGVEPKAKIEALRKIVIAALPQNEKGMLLLRAISDESPEVRAEAAAGLRALGLDD
ncbi:MAG: hypothetical protein FD180_4190, partial [Planctomycetota bacterium]